MSVLIKGMDMPDCCGHCRFKWNGDSTCYCLAQVGDERHRNIHIIKGSEGDLHNKREDSCPLVEVEEHSAFSNFDDKERTVYVGID